MDEPEAIRFTVAYARASSHEQKCDLDRQVARIAEWSSGQGIRIDRYVREIGSGLNDRRRELASILADPTVQTIVERVMATRSSWWTLVSATMTSCVT